jgi:hypothetical protein
MNKNFLILLIAICTTAVCIASYIFMTTVLEKSQVPTFVTPAEKVATQHCMQNSEYERMFTELSTIGQVVVIRISYNDDDFGWETTFKNNFGNDDTIEIRHSDQDICLSIQYVYNFVKK